jgi:hypothetical protein
MATSSAIPTRKMLICEAASMKALSIKEQCRPDGCRV